MSAAKVYKNNERLQFRGLTYRYNKTYGELHLLNKSPLIPMPRLILDMGEGGWSTSVLSGGSPEEVLEKYVQSFIEMKERDITKLTQTLALEKAVLKAAKSRSLK